MKKTSILMVLIGLLLLGSACGKSTESNSPQSITDASTSIADVNSSTQPIPVSIADVNTSVTKAIPSSTLFSTTQVSDTSGSGHQNVGQTSFVSYSSEKDGLVLTVTLPEKVVQGEPFDLIATIRNTTKTSVHYYTKLLSRKEHLEIIISLPEGCGYVDSYYLQENYSVAAFGTWDLEPNGGQYVETIRYEYAPSSPTTKGTFNAKATFEWATPQPPKHDFVNDKSLSLEFPLVVS